jgi:hypothetical protein
MMRGVRDMIPGRGSRSGDDLITMETLTDFQRRCEQALDARLRRQGVEARGRTIGGVSERFIRLLVADLTVYIYADGADIQGPGTDDRFERPDHRDLDGLCAAFAERVMQLVDERTSNHGSS